MLPERRPQRGRARPAGAAHSSTAAIPERQIALQSFPPAAARRWFGLVALRPCSAIPVAKNPAHPAARRVVRKRTSCRTVIGTGRPNFLDGIWELLLRDVMLYGQGISEFELRISYARSR